jgi:hypothetical protein
MAQTPATPPAADAPDEPPSAAPSSAPDPASPPPAPSADATSPVPAAAATSAAPSAATAQASPAKPASEGKPKATEPPAPHPSDGRSINGTGYTLPQGEIELGPFFMGVGIFDWLTVGTMPAPWIVAPILGGYSVNLSFKGGIPIGRYVNLGLEIDPLYLNIDTTDTVTQGWIVPVNLAGSLHPDTRQSYTLGMRYVAVEGVNDSKVDNQEIAGTALTRALQVNAQAQYQLTGAVAIYVQGALQVWEQQLQVSGNSQVDDSTSVEVNGEASSTNHARPWYAVVGTHLRFGVVNLRLGVGYGNIFVPRLGMSSRLYQGVVPDFDFYVRF